MSSKERLLLAINHKEPDYIPLTFKLSDCSYLKTYGWDNYYELVDILLEFGVDPILRFPATTRPLCATWHLRPEVTTRTWREHPPADEKYPLLFKEYHTQNGVLRQVVRQTLDWPYYGFYAPLVPMWCDHMVPASRSKEYLVENMEDVEKFAHLFTEATEKELEVYREEAERVRRFADERGVLVGCVDKAFPLMLGDAVIYCCGFENMVMMSHDEPEALHRLLDILLDWNIRYARQIMDLGVLDMIAYRSWYETESFWSPEMYRTFIAPRLTKLVEVIHSGGIKFAQMLTSEYMHLLPMLADAGVDILYGPDPVQDHGLDMQRLKREVGDRICIWGGVNSCITLARGTKRDIEREVTEAVRILGPGGGFILGGVDSLSHLVPWDNVEHMLKVWRKVRNYPLNIS